MERNVDSVNWADLMRAAAVATRKAQELRRIQEATATDLGCTWPSQPLYHTSSHHHPKRQAGGF
jgi:hypothetical protein